MNQRRKKRRKFFKNVDKFQRKKYQEYLQHGLLFTLHTKSKAKAYFQYFIRSNNLRKNPPMGEMLFQISTTAR